MRSDLDKLPRTWRGEIIRGVLYAFPRPRPAHQRAGGRVYRHLDDPFDAGRGGPGGWLILSEPGVEMPDSPEFSPDVAGWKRERLPSLPRGGPITIAPDWICEVLSRRTRAYDHVVKRRFYAEIGVSWLWYIDPLDRTLTASRLEGNRWLEIGAWMDSAKVRAEPFEAVELDLSALWQDVDVDSDEQEPSPIPPSTSG